MRVRLIQLLAFAVHDVVFLHPRNEYTTFRKQTLQTEQRHSVQQLEPKVNLLSQTTDSPFTFYAQKASEAHNLSHKKNAVSKDRRDFPYTNSVSFGCHQDLAHIAASLPLVKMPFTTTPWQAFFIFLSLGK